MMIALRGVGLDGRKIAVLASFLETYEGPMRAQEVTTEVLPRHSCKRCLHPHEHAHFKEAGEVCLG